MLLFGITGSINHGKTAFSNALTGLKPTSSRHFTSFQVIASVAEAMHKTTHSIPPSRDIEAINTWLEPLPAILSEQVHAHTSISQINFSREDVEKSPQDYTKLLDYLDNLKDNPSLLNQPINESNVESYRPFLQWLGGYLVAKVSPGIWYEEIIRRVKQGESQHKADLCIIDGLRYPNDAKLVEEAGGVILEISRPGIDPIDTQDVTERERQLIRPDILIVNDGGISGLQKVARQILRDVKNNNYQKTYQVSSLS